MVEDALHSRGKMSQPPRTDTPQQPDTAGTRDAAVGFRAHAGWSTVVVISGLAQSLTVIERRRIELANPKVSGSKQPYHSAEYLSRQKAEEFVKKCIKETQGLTRNAVNAIVDDIREKGYQVVRSGIVLGSLPSTPDLEAAFASHVMAHAAEGEMFRNAITIACKSHGLPVVGLRERELFVRGAPELGLSIIELRDRLTELGRRVGPPWRQDEKQAALVAWLALAAKS